MSSVIIKGMETVQRALEKKKKNIERAQKWLDNEVLKDCEPYVPFDTGALTRSGNVNSQLGSGEVIWNTVYARYQYYGNGFNFQRTHHPQACSQWFEVAKAAKLNSWVDGYKRIVTGG